METPDNQQYKDSLITFVNIRKKLIDISESKAEIIGKLNFQKNEAKALEELIESNTMDDIVMLKGKSKTIKDLNDNDIIELKLYPNNLKSSKYFRTLNDLIKIYPNTLPDQKFYINEDNFFCWEDTKPKKYQQYENLIKLVNFLSSISKYENKENNWLEIFFFQTKHIIIPIIYSSDKLKNLSHLDILITHISDSTNKEERKILFINELIELLYPIEKNKRFQYLLKRFSILNSNYQKSYTLYLEGYSYHKFKSEIDKELIDYSKKIQSIINDAQTKLIGIPIAFLLIISQFDISGTKLYYNITLLVSSIIFGIILHLFIQNQFSALEFVKDDVSRFKKSLEEKDNLSLEDYFNDNYNKIINTYNRQRKYLTIITVLIWLTPLLTLILLTYSIKFILINYDTFIFIFSSLIATLLQL